MQVSRVEDAPNYYDQAGNLRTGESVARVLLTGEEDAPDNYRLTYLESVEEGNWTTPRHHHNFEQIRYSLVGDYSIAHNKDLPAGWVGYFPEAVYYGPQVMRPNLRLIVLQFGGPSGLGFASTRQRRAGLDQLLATGGKLENGIYTIVDENGVHRNQDAYEAVWETMHGRKIEYPEPRYDGLVLMNPDSYTWVPDAGQRGVSRKTLGSFTERDLRVGFVKLAAGATFQIGTQPSAEMAVVQEGEVTYQGDSYGRLSAFGTTAADQPFGLTASADTLLFYIKLGNFGPNS